MEEPRNIHPKVASETSEIPRILIVKKAKNKSRTAMLKGGWIIWIGGGNNELFVSWICTFLMECSVEEESAHCFHPCGSVLPSGDIQNVKYSYKWRRFWLKSFLSLSRRYVQKDSGCTHKFKTELPLAYVTKK
jgi:hypothetical protein